MIRSRITYFNDITNSISTYDVPYTDRNRILKEIYNNISNSYDDDILVELEFTKEIHGTIGMKNCIINPTDHDDVYIIRSYDSYSNTPSIVYGYIGIDYEEV